MTMVLVGIWHDRVAIFFRDQPEHGYRVELDRKYNTIDLYEGGPRRAILSAFDAEETDDFPWYVADFKVDRTGFARCTITPVKFDGGPYHMRGVLPPNHEMPWPHTRNCEGYLKTEELMRECVLRRDSARDHGISLPTPPGYVTRALNPEMRIALFS